jgi:Ca2+/Na+ antiporter
MTPPGNKRNRRTLLYAFFIVVPLLVIVGVPFLLWFFPSEPQPWTKLLYWGLAIVSLSVFVFTLGVRINSRLLGALIDERNQMSLSRLQLIIWTVIVISGYATAALWNLFATDATDPLAVGVPQELWWLLGISTTSFVGSPLILSTKKNQEANTAQKEDNEAALIEQQGSAPDSVDTEGVVVVNKTPEQARLADMFTGDEIGNGPHLDLGKVQLFFFTIILVVAYGMALGQLFLSTSGQVGEFPTLSESILVLLGISHASYLTYKAVPHSEPADKPQVPVVVGLEVAAADKAIKIAGFASATVAVQSNEPVNKVLASQPPAGTPLDPGSTVTLVYSRGV